MGKSQSKSKSRSSAGSASPPGSAGRGADAGREAGASGRAGESPSETASRAEVVTLRPLVRRLLTAVILFHLLAVFLPPFTFATRSTPGVVSPAALPVMVWIRPYVDALFLDHGYFFFAPNPGASHLLRYRAEFADGREAIEGTLPDLKEHFPRLLYHRHFMLAEQLHAMYTPPLPPAREMPDPEQRRAWQARRDAYLAKRDAFREHLRQRLGADHVRVIRIEHRPPDVFEVLDGKPLESPDLYLELRDDR